MFGPPAYARVPRCQEKRFGSAGGLITDEQAHNLFELSSLQLIVHALGMVDDKTLAETATNSAMWEKPDVHAGLAAH